MQVMLNGTTTSKAVLYLFLSFGDVLFKENLNNNRPVHLQLYNNDIVKGATYMKSFKVFLKTFFVISGLNLLLNYFDFDLLAKDLKHANRRRKRWF